MQFQDEYSSESVPSSTAALANFLISSNGAEAGRARPRSLPARFSRGRVSELSRIRGGAVDLDEEDLLNFDVEKPATKAQSPLGGKMQMPSQDEIEKLMNDPQMQEQMRQMMSDPNFQAEMRKAAEQMKDMMSPEDLKALEDMQKDPQFQEQVRKITEQMQNDPEFMKAAEKQREAMQDAIEQALKDPEAMTQLKMLLDQNGLEMVKPVIEGIVAMLPEDRKAKYEAILESSDLEEKIRSATTIEDLVK